MRDEGTCGPEGLAGPGCGMNSGEELWKPDLLPGADRFSRSNQSRLAVVGLAAEGQRAIVTLLWTSSGWY
jgi:hypothetical protein